MYKVIDLFYKTNAIIQINLKNYYMKKTQTMRSKCILGVVRMNLGRIINVFLMKLKYRLAKAGFLKDSNRIEAFPNLTALFC